MRAFVVVRSAFLRLMLIVLSLAVALIMLEAVARLIPLWPDKISDFDPELGFAHIPGAEGWWVNIAWPFEFRTYVTISSQGLRDREFDLEKPAGVTRVLLLGDSLVEGLEVPLEDTLGRQLERISRESGRDVEVINGGHYGYGTDQELLFYRHRGRQFQPDVVVLFFMTNDVESNLSAESLGPKPFFELGPDGKLQLKNFPVTPPESPDLSKASFPERVKQTLYTHSKLYRFTAYHVRQDLPGLRSFLMELGIMAQTGEPGPYEAITSDYHERGWALTQALILEIEKEVESSGAEFVMVTVADFQQFAPGAETPVWNDTKWIGRLESLCADYGLQCLDLFPTFRSLVAQGRNETLFYPRDGHPTSEGHLHIAEALYGYLSQRLP
jgi:lysophospholipase L1-like esterase